MKPAWDTNHSPINHDTWRQELRRIESSRAFAASRRMRALLTFLINEMLEGRQDRLKEYTIGTAVLGRSNDFDARIDSTVRNEAWRLRSRLKQYYADEGSSNPVRIEFAPRSFIPRLRSVDFSSELAATSMKYTGNNDHNDEPISLTVLPFLVRDVDLRESDIGVAIAQELCMLLGAHAGLRVFMPLKDGADIIHIRNVTTWATQSRVRWLLRGTLQRSSRHVRAMAQIVELRDGRQIWAHGATRRYGNQLRLQCGIASELASALLLNYTELARASDLRGGATLQTHQKHALMTAGLISATSA